MVELHRDVGADPLLDAHRRLRREGDRPTVEMRAEERPLLGHLHLLGEAEHLKPTTIGEHRPVPSHEPRDAAGRLDDLLTGAEVEVVGIGQHHSGASAGDSPDVDPLHRRGRCHGHEQRGGHRSAGGDERAGPGPIRGRLLYPTHRRDGPPLLRSIVFVHASPVHAGPNQPGRTGALPMQWYVKPRDRISAGE